MPQLSLAVFIEAEEQFKAKIISDLKSYNYESKEQDELLESISI